MSRGDKQFVLGQVRRAHDGLLKLLDAPEAYGHFDEEGIGVLQDASRVLAIIRSELAEAISHELGGGT